MNDARYDYAESATTAPTDMLLNLCNENLLT